MVLGPSQLTYLTQASAEGLTLERSDGASGYKGVRIDKRGDMRCPYEARLKRGGRDLYLGHVSDRHSNLGPPNYPPSEDPLTPCSPILLSPVCHRRGGGPGLRKDARGAGGAGQLQHQGHAAHDPAGVGEGERRGSHSGAERDQRVRLQGRADHSQLQDQALPSEGDAQRKEGIPRRICHRLGGGSSSRPRQRFRRAWCRLS